MKSLAFEFWVSIERVEDVRCEGDHLVGRWAHPFKLYRPFSNLPGRHLIEDFLNWGDDPASIVKFARKYGVFTPVQIGQQFRVPLSSWRELQVHFRQLFSWLVTLVSPPVQMDAALTTEIKGLLTYEGRKARLQVSTLEQFLVLDLALCPRELLRVCRNQHCTNCRFFVASRRRESCCSLLSKREVQRERKLAWWNREGKKRRAKPAKAKRDRRKRR